jgi:hypothetical protein
MLLAETIAGTRSTWNTPGEAHPITHVCHPRALPLPLLDASASRTSAASGLRRTGSHGESAAPARGCRKIGAVWRV